MSALVYKAKRATLAHVGPSEFFLQNSIFSEWAMLGSNQRPLPCEGSKVTTAVYRHIPKMRVHKPTWRLKHTSLLRPSPPFRARVAAHRLWKFLETDLYVGAKLLADSSRIHRCHLPCTDMSVHGASGPTREDNLTSKAILRPLKNRMFFAQSLSTRGTSRVD